MRQRRQGDVGAVIGSRLPRTYPLGTSQVLSFSTDYQRLQRAPLQTSPHAIYEARVEDVRDAILAEVRMGYLHPHPQRPNFDWWTLSQCGGLHSCCAANPQRTNSKV
jgi:hypothetical protein